MDLFPGDGNPPGKRPDLLSQQEAGFAGAAFIIGLYAMIIGCAGLTLYLLVRIFYSFL